MINVSDELKSAVINEEMPKTLTISTSDRSLDKLNWLSTPVSAGMSVNYTPQSYPNGINVSSFFRDSGVVYDYFSYANWLVLSFRMRSASSFTGTIKVTCIMKNGTEQRYETQYASPYADRVEIRIENPKNIAEIRYVDYIPRDYSGNSISFTFIGRPQVYLSMVDDLPVIPIPYNNLLYATEENIRKYIPKSFPTTVSNSNIISESFGFEESICSANTLKFGACESAKIEVSVFNTANDYSETELKFDLDINSKGSFDWNVFRVKKVEKRAIGDSMIKSLSAYDALYNLNDIAYSWYTQYMFGMNFTRQSLYRDYHFDYERQIFSTYWNLARSFNIDGEWNVSKWIIAENWTSLDTSSYFVWGNTSSKKVYMSKGTLTNDGTIKAISVTPTFNSSLYTDAVYQQYCAEYDSLGRGVTTGDIMLEFTVAGQADTVNFLADPKDVVLCPDNWTSVDIYISASLHNESSTLQICSSYFIEQVSFLHYDIDKIINAKLPLVYYAYVSGKPTMEDIFKANSGITARDVMRSLMEMCGCFYRIGRDGYPQFIYPQEHGLYPANDLYPADTLFPKKSGEMTMPTSYYISAEFAEFQVEKFGGIQVVVDGKDNTGAVVRAEYWVDDELENAYLIDDNIFLCSDQFQYYSQSTPEIDNILQNMYGVLDNLQYTPFTAETIGTPFLESGDRFTLLTKSDGFESFIFERKLRGIQALKDHFEARGVARTPRVKNFEWQ